MEREEASEQKIAKDTVESLIEKGRELYSRMGGFANPDARIVAALMRMLNEEHNKIFVLNRKLEMSSDTIDKIREILD